MWHQAMYRASSVLRWLLSVLDYLPKKAPTENEAIAQLKREIEQLRETMAGTADAAAARQMSIDAKMSQFQQRQTELTSEFSNLSTTTTDRLDKQSKDVYKLGTWALQTYEYLKGHPQLQDESCKSPPRVSP